MDHLVRHTTQPGILNRSFGVACEDHKVILSLADLGQDFRRGVTLSHLPLGLETQSLHSLSRLNGHLQPMPLIPKEVFDLTEFPLMKKFVMAEALIHLWDDVQDNRLDVHVP